MKIYCYYTPSYETIVKEWFLPSLKDDYEVITEVGTYKGGYVSYKDKNWYNITCEKADFVIKTIKSNWGKQFIFSDPDVQFFAKTKRFLLKASRNKDLVLQRNNPGGMLCTGFFICRSNDRTLRLWKDIHSFVSKEQGDDQDGMNYSLLLSRKWPLNIKCSQLGINPYGIKWQYLPIEFLNAGTLNGRQWKPGMALEIPQKLILHHANWTVGMENKIKQLEYVRGVVTARTETS